MFHHSKLLKNHVSILKDTKSHHHSLPYFKYFHNFYSLRLLNSILAISTNIKYIR